MTDDPCDDLPDMHRRQLHGIVILDRTTDPTARRSIKSVMNTHYGRLGKSYMSRGYATVCGLLNDPHDSWDRHTFIRSIYSPPVATCPRCYRLIVKGQPCYGCSQ